MNKIILTTISIGCNDPDEVADTLRGFAEQIETGRILPGMSGEQTERCDGCGEQTTAVWSIAVDQDEDDEDDGSVTIDTPFGTIRVVPLDIGHA